MNNYFSHDSNARNSDKIINLRMKFGAEGYGIYFMILERLREEPEYMSIKDYNMIAFDFRVGTEKVKSVIEDFGLFVFTDDGKYFYSDSFKERMTLKDEKTRKRSEAGTKGMRHKWGETEKSETSSSKIRSQRLKLARDKGTHTQDEWTEMKDFFKECIICGSKENIVKDHIIPIYQGGSDSITNIQPLCTSCNSRKGPDNKDYRIGWCQEKNVEMPNEWLTEQEKCLTRKEKESKEKESKENTPPHTPPSEVEDKDRGGGNILISDLKKSLSSVVSLTTSDIWEGMRLSLNGDLNSYGGSVLKYWLEHQESNTYYTVIQSLQYLEHQGKLNPKPMPHEDYFAYLYVYEKCLRSDAEKIKSMISNPSYMTELKKLIIECKKGKINSPGAFILSRLKQLIKAPPVVSRG